MSKREVSVNPTWINAHENPPHNGSRVLGLTKYGCMVVMVWNSDSINWCDAHIAFPAVPESIKKIQGDRWMVKGETQ